MITVTLNRNGKYWQARWTDSRTGEQKGRSLGAIGKTSARAAKVKAQQVEQALNRGRHFDGKVPGLAEYIEAFIASKSNISKGTANLYRLTGRYLTHHFGPDRKIDSIGRAEAREWRTRLAQGDLAEAMTQHKGIPKESTVCRSTKEAKAIFAQAADDEIIPFNPFGRLSSSAPKPDKNWEYIDLATLGRLLDAATGGWKLLIALCRLAGLRRGEAIALRWSDVDLERRRLIVNNAIEHQDTKHRRRETPIVPQLHAILFDAFMDGQAGDRVVTDVHGCWHRGFAAIAARARVAMYARPYHTLRRNCERDWLESGVNLIALTEFLGHSPAVASRHYLKAEESDFEKISHPHAPSTCPSMLGK